jgi:hypothetical protein
MPDAHDIQQALLNAALTGDTNGTTPPKPASTPGATKVVVTFGKVSVTLDALFTRAGTREFTLVPIAEPGFLRIQDGVKASVCRDQDCWEGVLRYALTWDGKDVFSLTLPKSGANLTPDKVTPVS